MTSLRIRVVLAGMLVLSASTLSAQGTRISCKDGSRPKIGHFSCWGHGGLVTRAAKSAPKTGARATGKVAKKEKAKARTKHARTNARAPRATKQSAK